MTNRRLAHFLLASSLKLALMLLLLFVFVSCSKTSTTESVPLGEQELPDMLLEKAQYTLGRPNEDALIMEASSIEIYKSSKGTILEDVQFWQDSEDGFRGSCGHAQVNEASTHAILSENVEVIRESDNLHIYAQDLEWDNAKMTLQTQGTVSVVYGDGTEIEAEGFFAQLDENNFEFGSITRGTINE